MLGGQMLKPRTERGWSGRKVLVALLLAALFVQSLPVMVSAQATTDAETGAETNTETSTEPDDDTIQFEDYALPVTDYTLENGLRVILAEDHSAPVVAVDIWFHVGGANDPMDRSGFAHLFEHMMFEGSENIANGQWDILLEPSGAYNNAYTAADNTGYWEVAPANELPLILWMESDRMRSLNVTEEAYENQRAVVIQEYNERVANAPYGFANTRLFSQPLLGYAPYERPVIGSVEELQAAPFADVQAFYDLYYKPNNATLVVVGDIDIEQTQALIQAYFSDIPAGEPIAPILEQYPLPEEFPVVATDETTGCSLGTEETVIDAQIRLPRLGLSVVAPPRGNPDYYALELLTSILSGGNSSRLERNIVQEGEAAAAFVSLNPLLGATIFYGIAYPNAGDSPEDMLALLQEEFTRVREEGVTEAELARVKRQVQVGSLTSYRGSVLDTAEWLQDATLTFGTPDSIIDELEMYTAVTAEDVQRVAQTYLCDRPMNLQIVLPEGEQVLVEDVGVEVTPVAATPEVATGEPLVLPESAIAELPEGTVASDAPPAALGELTSNFPPFQSFTLDNGLEVIFVEQHEVPKLTLQLVVGGSNSAAPPDKQGIADLMADLITKGTVKRSAAGIANTIESVGGSISASAALEWTTLTVEALTTETDLAFNLLSEVARYATFPQQEFDVAKQQTLTFLEQDQVDPASMADRQFARVAFGGHPYGYITSPETVENITRADVREFHRTFYRPNNALLVIVGDLTAEEALAQAERALGHWRTAEVPDFLDYPEREPADDSVIYLVDRPGSEQATMQVGNIAIDARNPDRYALEVVNRVLGPGLTSRLNRNLREEKGLTYGVTSRFAQPNDEATFRVVGDFNQESTGLALTEILRELEIIRTEPISETELEDAKGGIAGGFALGIEDPAVFASQLAFRALTGVPIEELNDYLPSIEAVTAEDALAAAQQYIDSETPIIVVVGDAATLRPQLEEIAPVQLVDNAGNPVAE